MRENGIVKLRLWNEKRSDTKYEFEKPQRLLSSKRRWSGIHHRCRRRKCFHFAAAAKDEGSLLLNFKREVGSLNVGK